MPEVYVPRDVLLNHILPRVPPKSIGRFRCVSREWNSLLTSDVFQYKHIDHHQDNIKLMLFSKTETSSLFEFTTIDCEEPPTHDKGLTPTCRPLPKFRDTNPPRDIHVLTSFHGLVCLGIITKRYYIEYSDLILWNPVTKEYKRLSKTSLYTACTTTSIFGLYYSSSEDDYKLLSLKGFHPYVYIYSVKSDSWRKVDAFQSTHILNHWGWSRGTYLNGSLYFLQHHDDNKLPLIIKFDTKTERLSKIETPNVDKAYHYFATIVVKSDCIHVCVKYHIHTGLGITTNIELWKLDEYENLEKVLTHRLRQLRMNPFYLMKNGNWLVKKNLGCYNYNDQIYKVDLSDNNDSEYDAIKVKLDLKYNIVLEAGRYIETFVSPNRYME